MNPHTTPATAGPELFFDTNHINALDASNSPSFVARALAWLAAGALVIASAGFGCLFAWKSNEPHGEELAALAVLFAAALELAKPLAVAACFTGLSSLRTTPRGAAMALLACAAITYSLTAELSLWSGARGDNAARRAAQIDRQNARQATAELAQRELATLPRARSPAELQPIIDALLADKRLNGCKAPWPTNSDLRNRCTEASGLQSELGRSQRRQSLQDTIATSAASEPDRATVKSADPAAAAISTYLAAVGIKLPADALTAWLSLVPVMALEIGSALAGLLVASYAPAARTYRRSKTGDHRAPAIGATPAIQVASETPMPIRQGADAADHAPITPDQPICGDQREVLERLKRVSKAGSIKASQRGLARLIGVPQSSLNEKLHLLAAAGVIALSTSNVGTAITLHG